MPTLDLAGREFACKDELPGWQLCKLAAATDTPVKLYGAYHDFFMNVLDPDVIDDFRAHMDKADDVRLDDIEEAFASLMAEYGRRPTVKSSSLPAGVSPTPAPSKVVDLSRGSRPDSSKPGRSQAS